MTKSTLRTEKTEVGKEIWQAVDKAAERAPKLVKETIVKVTNKDQRRASSVDATKRQVSKPGKSQGGSKG